MKAKLAPYVVIGLEDRKLVHDALWLTGEVKVNPVAEGDGVQGLSLIHISEPTRPY